MNENRGALEPTSFGIFGAAAAANGYPVFPIPRTSKRTSWRGWQRWCSCPPTDADLGSWCSRYPTHNTAIACGHFVFAIDIDEMDSAASARLRDLTFTVLGTSTPLIRIGRAPRQLLLYRVLGEAIRTSRHHGVEILGDGAYFVASGIHPGTQKPYLWLTETPATLPLEHLPTVTRSSVERLRDEFKARLDVQHQEHGDGGGPSPARFVLRPFGLGPIRHNEAGLVVDGRDGYLAGLVWQAAVSDGELDGETVAKKAWERFKQTAELSRPKRNGVLPWSFRDASTKARALLASGKTLHRRSRSNREHGFWTDPTKQMFGAVVTDFGARGRLPPSAVNVSHFMLSLVYGDGNCFASVGTIAHELGLSKDTVKQAKRQLRQTGLWTSHHDRGGNGASVRYQPNPRALTFQIGLQLPIRPNGGGQNVLPDRPGGRGVGEVKGRASE